MLLWQCCSYCFDCHRKNTCLRGKGAICHKTTKPSYPTFASRWLCQSIGLHTKSAMNFLCGQICFSKTKICYTPHQVQFKPCTSWQKQPDTGVQPAFWITTAKGHPFASLQKSSNVKCCLCLCALSYSLDQSLNPEDDKQSHCRSVQTV